MKLPFRYRMQKRLVLLSIITAIFGFTYAQDYTLDPAGNLYISGVVRFELPPSANLHEALAASLTPEAGDFILNEKNSDRLHYSGKWVVPTVVDAYGERWHGHLICWVKVDYNSRRLLRLFKKEAPARVVWTHTQFVFEHTHPQTGLVQTVKFRNAGGELNRALREAARAHARQFAQGYQHRLQRNTVAANR